MIIDREHELLLHEVVGGHASPEDTARLEAWLQSSAEGRQRRLELEALFAALADVPRVPPPASLRADVLEAIRAQARPAASPAQPWQPRAWFLVPVAMVAVAVVIALPWGRQALRPDLLPDVSGSLATRVPTAAIRTVLSVAGTRVALSTSRGKGETTVAFDAGPNAALAIELVGDPATLARATVNGLAPGAIQRDATQGRLTMAPGGPARFTLSFRPALRRDESVKVIVRVGELHADGVLPQPMEER